MILFESGVPPDRRPAVAGLIRSAAVKCELRKRFYAVAADAGLRAATEYLGTQEGHNPAMLSALRREIDDVIEELLET